MNLAFLILSLSVLLLAHSSLAQKPQPSVKSPRRLVFTVVQQPPAFPGGETAMIKYLERNLRFPDGADRKTMNDELFAKFIVTESGRIDSIIVMRSKDEKVEAEVTRVIRNMPEWSPGKQNGHLVPSWYNIPIRFTK